MSRSTRPMLFFIFAALFALLFTACGGSTTTATPAASSGPVNLTYWSWIPNIDKQVALFNQTHPNIHVTYQNVGSGPVEYNKLYTGIKANNTPDLAQVEYQLLPTFETTGGLLDLSAYGASSVKGQYVPWTWNQVTQGSAIYAIPQDTGPMAMFYRADIFKKYNIPVPTTWAEYAADAAKLHAADPKEYMTDFNPKQPGQIAGLMWQAGAQWFQISGQSWKVNINDAASQKVATYWQDLISKKLVQTQPDFVNSWYHDLQTGAVATWLTGAWGAGIIEQNAPQSSGKWKVALLPQWQAGQQSYGNWGGSTTVVFKDSKHPKEAAEFAQWISGNAQSEELEIKGGGTYPALISAATSSPTLNNPQDFFGGQNINDVFKPTSAKVNTSFLWGPTMDQVYNDLGDQYANAVNGKGTLNDALNAVQQSTLTFMQKQGFTVAK
ncbi:MAG TPA: extracellular solute-binding protein [Ktedonobacteraceae bacterium]